MNTESMNTPKTADGTLLSPRTCSLDPDCVQITRADISEAKRRMNYGRYMLVAPADAELAAQLTVIVREKIKEASKENAEVRHGGPDDTE